MNGDPFVGSFETPVTSSPLVANYLSNLPAYRTGVSPSLRGVEIGLAHGFLLAGPFIKVSGGLRTGRSDEGVNKQLQLCTTALLPLLVALNGSF